MNLKALFIMTLLCLSCSQKDIVADYERRIASVYSYTQSKINTRNKADIIIREFALTNKCKLAVAEEKRKCTNEYYRRFQSEFNVKRKQILQLANLLKDDLKHYRKIINDYRNKVNLLKIKNTTTNKKNYTKLIKSLEDD